MGFRKGAYATVWSVDGISQTLTKAQISISRKDPKTGKYEQDFGAFVAFIGSSAAKRALELKERDRIKLGDVDVSTKYDKEKREMYTNFKIFSFEMADEAGDNNRTEHTAPAEEKTEPLAEIDDSNLPF